MAGLSLLGRFAASAMGILMQIDVPGYPPAGRGGGRRSGVRRRDLLAVLGGAAALRPFTLRAQQSKVPTIGVLSVANPEPFFSLFRQALRDRGYINGQNIQMEYRSAAGKPDLLPGLAAELVRLKVDVIVASLTPAVQAAKEATKDIPIVMAPAGAPVETGLIASLARPGGNITGLSATTAELGGKRLELIREMLPTASRVAVLASATDSFSKPFLDETLLAGRILNIQIRSIIVSGGDEFDAAFSTMDRERIDAVIVQGSLPTKLAADLALKHRLPSISTQRWFVEEGGLMSYTAKLAEQYREAALYVDKILKGAKPADLPVAQPTRFELVINMKTANSLGLTVPQALLARADEVIVARQSGWEDSDNQDEKPGVAASA